MEDRFADQDEEDRLKRSLSHLPDDDRELLEHLFWDGQTESEIASGLGITQQAVNKRKHKLLSEVLRRSSWDGNRSINKLRKPNEPGCYADTGAAMLVCG